MDQKNVTRKTIKEKYEANSEKIQFLEVELGKQNSIADERNDEIHNLKTQLSSIKQTAKAKDEIDNEMIVTKPKPISYEQDVLEVEEEVIERELSSKDDLPTNRKTFSLDDVDEVVTTPKRRRVRNSNQNKQGPIMTTKRKVLGGDIKSKKSPKVNIKSVKKGVKTRKVRIVSKDADDTVE